MHNKQEAFTLVELLIVIAILALLAGLLLPVIAASRRKAQAVTCVNHLRQIGVSLHMYEQDYESLPPQLQNLWDSGTLNDSRLLACPMDASGDYGRRSYQFMHQHSPDPVSKGDPIQTVAGSYLYIGQFWTEYGRELLTKHDNNFAMLVCVTHGQEAAFGEGVVEEYEGEMIRLRRDGSVATFRSMIKSKAEGGVTRLYRSPGYFTDYEGELIK